MADPLPLVRLLATDPETIGELRILVEVALHARRDLWTARSPDGLERVRRRRQVVDALWAGSDVGSDPGTAEHVGSAGRASSGHVIATVSAREAAGMLGISRERVLRRLKDPDDPLTGEQDRPGCPWRVHDTDHLRARQDTP